MDQCHGNLLFPHKIFSRAYFIRVVVPQKTWGEGMIYSNFDENSSSPLSMVNLCVIFFI